MFRVESENINRIFFYLKSISTMTYSDVTKRFWKIGYRLFHGKFLHFMGGPKYTIGDVDQRGTPDINFAVPSLSSLSEFAVSSFDIPSSIEPGVIKPVLETLSALGPGQYMLCADGKKVTSGVDSKGGDVDMFGYEDGTPLYEKKQKLENHKTIIKNITTYVDMYENEKELTSMAKDDKHLTKLQMDAAVTVVGFRLKESRELAFRQRFGMEKFKAMAGPAWRDSRYVYVISSLQASLFQLKELTIETLLVVDTMLHLMSCLNVPVAGHVLGKFVDGAYQHNLITLPTFDPDQASTLEPQFIKQRSDRWFQIRRRARITGSTLHSGIGLRGLKELQKHFGYFMEGKEKEPFSEDVQKRMDHGTIHEKDAIATLVGKILPSFFPSCVYVEEGCYTVSGYNTDILGIVSPDGSIRELTNSPVSGTEKVVAAVEVKCPYPSEKSLPVHYKLPEYYVCQCLAEMHVLNTNTLVYISYSESSSSFLKVRFDGVLWGMVMNEIEMLYDKELATKPVKTSPTVRDIKIKIKEFVESNVEFICEVPSCQMTDSCLRTSIQTSKYQFALNRSTEEIQKAAVVDEVHSLMKRSLNVLETTYNLLRTKATEVMVWVLTNKNRNSRSEIPCSVPVAYGLKNYRLTANAMRKATEEVLKRCDDNGVRILTFYTDGQWIKIMTRDEDENPLTLHQLTKDIWKSVQKKTKKILIDDISPVNRINENHLQSIELEKELTGALSVKLKNGRLFSISTSLAKDLWRKRNKEPDNSEDLNIDEEIMNEATSWLPEDIVNSIPTNDDTELTNAICEVSNEVMNSSLQPASDLTEVMNHSGNIISETEEMNIAHEDNSEHNVESSNLKIDALQNLAQSLHKDVSDLSSKKKIEKLKVAELNNLYATIKDELPNNVRVFKKSWRKPQKVSFVCGLLGLQEIPEELLMKPRRLKRRNPFTLRQLATKTIKAKSYPKLVLSVAYASYIFPGEKEKWQKNAPFQSPTLVQGLDVVIPYWYAYPETRKNGSLIAKGTDCSHNLTHLRVRTSKTGIRGISPDAWRECAKSRETLLSVPLVEDLIDKQSVPNARTHFSWEVESWMRLNGYVREANFTKIVRNWYEASDEPGRSALERVQHLLSMRDFLLDGVNFSKFPPHGMYIGGIPVVTFEGMMLDIDTKLQLYGITDNYNIRAVGSLAAETTVGILQAHYPNPQVSIKARDVPTLMSSVIEVMTCKSNPNR